MTPRTVATSIPSAAPPAGAPGEAGTALVGSLVGVTIFLVFLFAAVQVLTALYATSTLTAVATDSARSVASRTVDHSDPAAVEAAERSADANARRTLGAYASHVRFEWSVSTTAVRLRVVATNARLAFPGFLGAAAFTRVDRTVVLRIEGPTG